MSGLLDRHIGFVQALRAAGLPVSLAEGLDAVDALGRVGWGDREVVRDVYAATLVKRQVQRATFDAVFDLYFPRLLGAGVAGDADPREASQQAPDGAGGPGRPPRPAPEALETGDRGHGSGISRSRRVGRFGAMPGRGPGLSSWSAYTALRRVAPAELVDRIVAGTAGRGPGGARRRPGPRASGSVASRPSSRPTRAAGSPRRRDPTTSQTWRCARPSTGSTSPRPGAADLEEMRRELYPLRAGWPPGWPRSGTPAGAGRSTSGVPSGPRCPRAGSRSRRTTAPSDPHRTELVVLCDVVGLGGQLRPASPCCWSSPCGTSSRGSGRSRSSTRCTEVTRPSGPAPTSRT